MSDFGYESLFGRNVQQNIDQAISERTSQVKESFDRAIGSLRVIQGLKSSNPEFDAAINHIVGHAMSEIPANGGFSDGYSYEFQLGYMKALSIFSNSSTYIKNLENRKKIELGEHRGE